MRIFTLLLCLLLGASFAHAQLFPELGGQRAGISALTYLKLDVNPRSVGVGGASLCLSGDGYSLFTHPASLAETDGLSLGLANAFWVSGINFAAVGAGLPTRVGHFGLSVAGLNSGAMQVRTEFQPDGTGELFYANYFTTGLTYSRQLTDYFRFGVTGRYVRESFDGFTANTAMFDLGFLYRTDFRELSFAVLLENFGGNSDLRGMFNLEKSLDTDETRETEEYPSPTVFRLGASILAYRSEDETHELMGMIQLNHPNDNAENIRLGLEYNWREILYLRAGYRLNTNDQSFPTAGFGLRSRVGRHPLRIDYGMSPGDFVGITHRVGLSFLVNTDER